jgi:hypothetical protein
VDDVTVGSVAVTVSQVQANGTVSLVSDAAQSDARNTGGSVVLVSAAGTLTVNDGNSDGVGVQSDGGNVLLQAANQVALNANVVATNGSLSVLAANDVTVAATAALLATGGTIDVLSTGGSVRMSAGSVFQTVGGNIRVQAAQDVVLSLLDARTAADRLSNTKASQNVWGSVSVTAVNGAIYDAAPPTTTSVNIYGAAARFTANGSVGIVGSSANPVKTEIAVLSALSVTGSVNVLDLGGLQVGTVAPVTVNRVQTDGTLVPVSDAASQTGVVKAAGGQTVVRTADGVSVADLPTFQILNTLPASLQPNPLTGYYEQVVKISNNNGSSIDAVRIYIRNLPSGVTVVDAAGYENGVPYVQVNQALAAGQSVNVTIEYALTSRSLLPFTPDFLVEAVNPLVITNPVGTQLATLSVTREPNLQYLLQFRSNIGLSYWVQYSDNNGTTWNTAIPVIAGTDGLINWLDSGAPKTASDSSSVATRIYRVIVVAAQITNP